MWDWQYLVLYSLTFDLNVRIILLNIVSPTKQILWMWIMLCIYDQFIRLSLIMIMKFIWALKFIRKMSATSIWICSSSNTHHAFYVLGELCRGGGEIGCRANSYSRSAYLMYGSPGGGGGLYCQVEHHARYKKVTFYIKHHQNESRFYQFFSMSSIHGIYYIVKNGNQIWLLCFS